MALSISSKSALVDLENLSDLLKEENAGENLTEVVAALQKELVLLLEELRLLVDITINLGEKLGRCDV